MFCTHCGKELNGNSRFCIYCGSPIQNVSAPTIEQPQPDLTEPFNLSQNSPEPVVEIPVSTEYPDEVQPTIPSAEVEAEKEIPLYDTALQNEVPVAEPEPVQPVSIPQQPETVPVQPVYPPAQPQGFSVNEYAYGTADYPQTTYPADNSEFTAPISQNALPVTVGRVLHIIFALFAFLIAGAVAVSQFIVPSDAVDTMKGYATLPTGIIFGVAAIAGAMALFFVRVKAVRVISAIVLWLSQSLIFVDLYYLLGNNKESAETLREAFLLNFNEYIGVYGIFYYAFAFLLLLLGILMIISFFNQKAVVAAVSVCSMFLGIIIYRLLDIVLSLVNNVRYYLRADNGDAFVAYSGSFVTAAYVLLSTLTLFVLLYLIVYKQKVKEEN